METIEKLHRIIEAQQEIIRDNHRTLKLLDAQQSIISDYQKSLAFLVNKPEFAKYKESFYRYNQALFDVKGVKISE